MSPLCSNGKRGEAKVLREQDRNGSDGGNMEFQLDLYVFLSTIDLCSK